MRLLPEGPTEPASQRAKEPASQRAGKQCNNKQQRAQRDDQNDADKRQ